MLVTIRCLVLALSDSQVRPDICPYSFATGFYVLNGSLRLSVSLGTGDILETVLFRKFFEFAAAELGAVI